MIQSTPSKAQQCKPFVERLQPQPNPLPEYKERELQLACIQSQCLHRIEELLRAIQMALKGKPYVTSQIGRGMQKSFIKNPRAKGQAKALTPRQREVVQLLAEGKSMKEVASVLKVTPRTVAFHKYRVMEELNLATTAELIQFAIKSRILVR